MQNNSNMVWLDMEMTGLDPYINTIIEASVLVTDSNLEAIDAGMSVIIHQSTEALSRMDQWNVDTHTKTGLIQKVLESSINMSQAEEKLLDYVKKFVTKKTSPLCGNTIWQDRLFLTNYMPKFNDYMHYRNIDVSTIKELSYKWYPELLPFKKQSKHTAFDDIQESVAELKYYRQHVFTGKALNV